MDARTSFSVASADYARNRPTYPSALFSWIASSCRAHRTAWDCGAGNGQAAMGLSGHFASVEASDISMEQVARGFEAGNVRYSKQAAERTDFADARFDLVAVAQALHWFDFDRFWPEARRVAAPGAFFCAWGYSWFDADADAELQAAFTDPMLALLEPYWAAENRLLWNGYASGDIRFPFERVAAPLFAIEVLWTIDEIVGYVRSWSAYKRALADARVAGTILRLETDALRRFAACDAWPIAMPISVVAGPIA